MATLVELAILLLPAALAYVVARMVCARRQWNGSGGWQRWPSLLLPPAPPGSWPLIGHLHLLGPLPHQVLAELARRHGPSLMSLRLGSVLAIVASTPQAAQLLLQTHDHSFASRPRTAATLHLAFDSIDIVTSPPNAYWRRMRLLCFSDLFSNKRIRSFRPIRTAGIRSLLSAILDHQSAGPIQLRQALLAVMLDIIAKMTIGRSLSQVSSHATDIISELMHLVGVANLGDCIPWLKCLDLQGYERRMKIVGWQWDSLLQAVLDERRDAWRGNGGTGGGGGSGAADLLDVLMALPDLTDDNIKAVIADMFLGGTETTSITIEWGLAELLANPHVLKALQNELDVVVGKARLVQEEDVINLPYLQATVKETMRLHPVAPFLVPHQSSQACKVCEYTIPANTRVLVNTWAIGRDPNVWDDPLQFDPNRFMEKGRCSHVNVHGRHFELLPFGSGKRKCPGLSLSLLTVHTVIASLVQAFDWQLPPGSPLVDLTEKFGLSLTLASPLCITPSPRIDVSKCYQNTI
ncbi:hypothetical protein L7F22_065465 [Adiantum nelumboides]|nr:hypothetical protein [Adiantum nelumboides]